LWIFQIVDKRIKSVLTTHPPLILGCKIILCYIMNFYPYRRGNIFFTKILFELSLTVLRCFCVSLYCIWFTFRVTHSVHKKKMVCKVIYWINKSEQSGLCSCAPLIIEKNWGRIDSPFEMYWFSWYFKNICKKFPN
jgi:hypothetical protein